MGMEISRVVGGIIVGFSLVCGFGVLVGVGGGSG